MLNLTTTKISPYPDRSFRGAESIRRLASTEDSFHRVSDSNTAYAGAKYQSNATQHSNNSINKRQPQRWSNRPEFFSYAKESDQHRPVTGAKVLMQLINEMGGGEGVAGPGRFLNIVI